MVRNTVKTLLKKRTPARQRMEDRADLRFVLRDDGTFAYTSPAFANALGMDVAVLQGSQAAPLLRFVADESPAPDRLMPDTEATQTYTDALRTGLHTLVCGPAHKRIDFQFDRVTGPDGHGYMVASAAATAGIPQREGDMQRLILQLVENPAMETGADAAQGASVALKPEELRQFLDMSPDLMCVIHPDGGVIRFNPAFTQTLGYTAHDMVGKAFADFVVPDDQMMVRSVFYNACRMEDGDASPLHMDCRMLAADGDVRRVGWLFRRGGAGLFGLGHDMTEQDRHEAALHRREQQLSEAQALAHMGHWRWDIGKTDIEWSSELYNIFGVNSENFTPGMETINALVHRRDLGRLYQAFQRAIIQQNDYEMDFRIIRPDGTLRTLRCEGRCELDGEGEVVALYGIMQDVTPQKEHEKALREAKDAAEAAYASKSRFLANMSHELRTPLNAIIGFSDLMDKQILGPLGNERYLDYVRAIRESGGHLLDLISDILDMSKIEAGKYELTLQDTNISQIIRTSVQMMEARAQEGRLVLECRLPDDDVVMRVDARAVKQIMLNLLSNAVKFTDAGGQVRAVLENRKDGVMIRVSDTGIGIPAHKIADITKPFEQVSNAFTRGHEGSGLGLSITKNLTELHGGTLTIDSRLGAGTTVSVFLPETSRSKDGAQDLS